MQLVRAIRTIHVSITPPLRQDAELRIRALELAVPARRIAFIFIAPVVAVELAVAAQRTADAPTISAAEFTFTAIPRRAASLIRSIAAIIIVIAAPSTRNAFVVVALFQFK